MELNLSAEDLRFQNEVRAFLDESLSDDLRFVADTFERSNRAPMQRWQAIKNDKGWGAPAWPVEYGGCGWSHVQQMIFEEEQRAAGAPLKSPLVSSW